MMCPLQIYVKLQHGVGTHFFLQLHSSMWFHRRRLIQCSSPPFYDSIIFLAFSSSLWTACQTPSMECNRDHHSKKKERLLAGNWGFFEVCGSYLYSNPNLFPLGCVSDRSVVEKDLETMAVHPALYHLRRNHKAIHGRMCGLPNDTTFKGSGSGHMTHARNPQWNTDRDHTFRKTSSYFPFFPFSKVICSNLGTLPSPL